MLTGKPIVMKEIKKEEVFGNFRDFLRSKGIVLQEEGLYTQRIRKGCEIVADSVNLSQSALRKTKSAVDRSLDHLRQVIHEQTAPKPPASQSPPGPAARTSPVGRNRKKNKPAPKQAKGKSRLRNG
jgi:hypothetical protein